MFSSKATANIPVATSKSKRKSLEVMQPLTKSNGGTEMNIRMEDMPIIQLAAQAQERYKSHKHDEAEFIIRLAIKQCRNSEVLSGLYADLALYVSHQGRQDEAWTIQLEHCAKNASMMFNLGWHELRHGNFQRGFELIECGREIGLWGKKWGLTTKRWHNKARPGKVLVIAECGLGDQIMFSRYAMHISKRRNHVILICDESLVNILGRIDGVKECYPLDMSKVPPEHDYWVPAMSLPMLLEMDSPSPLPYLKTKEEYVEKWKEKLASIPGPRIAVRWQGGPNHHPELRRTIPADQLCSALKPFGNLISIQRDAGIENCPDYVHNIGAELKTWDDTIAVANLVDITVSNCTSVPHAIAATGAPIVSISQNMPYVHAVGPKWYSNIVHYHQTDWRNWNAPIKSAAEYVQNFLQKLGNNLCT